MKTSSSKNGKTKQSQRELKPPWNHHDSLLVPAHWSPISKICWASATLGVTLACSHWSLGRRARRLGVLRGALRGPKARAGRVAGARQRNPPGCWFASLGPWPAMRHSNFLSVPGWQINDLLERWQITCNSVLLWINGCRIVFGMFFASGVVFFVLFPGTICLVFATVWN